MAKPRLILALILGGMTGVFTNVLFDSGLRAPAAPGSIIAVLLQTPADTFVGVILSVILSCTVTFLVAAFLLKLDRSEDEGDLSQATASMEAMKGKKSVASGALGGGAGADRERPIHSIVFACDAGMGSSAMGASVLRRKITEAGFDDVTVVNKAISSLGDDYDLVVTHQDLTARAQQRTASATHVSVENFMGSPRYDEIVELLHRTNAGATVGAGAAGAGAAGAGAAGAGAGAAPASSPDDDRDGGEGTDGTDGTKGTSDPVLSTGSIVLGGGASSMTEAIEEAGQLLVRTGAVEPAYVEAMHERETSVSTFMGNGLAIPHGTNEAKGAIRRTAVSFVRYDEPVDWKGKPATFVVGVAGAGDEHLAILAKLAKIFSDKAQVARLEAATSAEEVQEILSSVA
nr:PTS sugar transporter subunit IIA [Janibacter alkaliphilus]